VIEVEYTQLDSNVRERRDVSPQLVLDFVIEASEAGCRVLGLVTEGRVVAIPRTKAVQQGVLECMKEVGL